MKFYFLNLILTTAKFPKFFERALSYTGLNRAGTINFRLPRVNLGSLKNIVISSEKNFGYETNIY